VNVNKKTKLAIATFAIIQALAVGVLLFFSLRLWKYNLHVPFDYGGDTLWSATLIKSLLQNAWAFHIPQLSAPFGLDAAAFPGMANSDWAIAKMLTWILQDAGLTLNVFWLLTIIITGWTAACALSCLQVNRHLVFWGGVLYALLPYTFFRHTAHLCLVYYSVPLLSLQAIRVAYGRELAANDRKLLWIGYLACAVQGFDYIYYSFFAIILLAFSAMLGMLRQRSCAPLRIAGLSIAIIGLAALINLAPSAWSWHRNGKPAGLEYKSAMESEVYGLKIRHLIRPHFNNRMPFLGLWAKADMRAGFPNENENGMARLGMFGTIGFFLLLAISLSLWRTSHGMDSSIVNTLASLCLFSLLVTTVGGFGAVFNVLIAPDIRCYNRFSVFIAFFSIAGLCVWLSSRILAIRRAVLRRLAILSVVLLISFSLYDQLLGATELAATYPNDIASASMEKSTVYQIEAIFPSQSQIFQLPITDFPGDAGLLKMRCYDHARPYVWSKHLRWSWPSFSRINRTWSAKINQLNAPQLINALAVSGFSAIWIDKYGYGDEGQQLIANLIAAGAKDVLPGISTRYMILDIRDVVKLLKVDLGEEAFKQEAIKLLPRGVGFDFERTVGIYDLEHTPDAEFRWVQEKASLILDNTDNKRHIVTVSFNILSPNTGFIDFSTEHETRSIMISTTALTNVTFKLDIKPHDQLPINFVARVPRVNAPLDPRKMFYQIRQLQLFDRTVE